MQNSRRFSDEERLHLREDVVARLSRGQLRNDILFDLCRKNNLNWPQAEALLSELETVEHKRISRGRAILLLLVSLTMIAQGLLLVNPLSEVMIEGFLRLLRGLTPAHIAGFREAVLQNWFMVVLWLVLNISAMAGILTAVARMIEPD